MVFPHDETVRVEVRRANDRLIIVRSDGSKLVAPLLPGQATDLQQELSGPTYLDWPLLPYWLERFFGESNPEAIEILLQTRLWIDWP